MVLCSANSYAEWKLVTSNFETGMNVYVEDTSLRVSGDIAKVWTMYTFKTPQEKPQFRSLKTHSNYNCAEDEVKLTSELAYINDDGKGQSVHSRDFPDARWKPIVPNSNDALVKKWVCAK
jgi:hypothetical protein